MEQEMSSTSSSNKRSEMRACSGMLRSHQHSVKLCGLVVSTSLATKREVQ